MTKNRFKSATFIAAGVLFAGALLTLFVYLLPTRPLAPPEVPAGGGFSGGFWHGFRALWMVVSVSLEGDATIYQAANEGWWYDLGFIMGKVSILLMIRLPIMALRRRLFSPSEFKDPEAFAEECAKGIFYGTLATIMTLVMWIVVDPGSLTPAPAPDGWQPPVAEGGFFLGFLHSGLSLFALFMGIFMSDASVFQTGISGASYSVGFMMVSILTLVGVVVTSLRLSVRVVRGR